MKGIKTNVDWERLSLKPVAQSKLKSMCRSGLVRVALVTDAGLRFTMLTRHPKIAGRKAKRVKRGFFEVYEGGVGWIQMKNTCQVWLNP